MSEYFYVKGRDGKLVWRLIPENEFDIGDRIIELDPGKMIPNERHINSYGFGAKVLSDFLYNFWHEMERIYSEWGNFGKFGDIIFIRRDTDQSDTFSPDNDYDIIFIGWLEYKKPTLASDILPFFRCDEGEVYYVGILKKDKKTGKLHKALIGGIRDMEKYYYESAMEAGIRELQEETGLKIDPFNEVSAELVKDPNTTEVLIYTELPKLRSKMSVFVMKKVGSYWTDKSEIHKATETKRVNMTTAFSFLVDLNQKISPEELKTFFTAGDDADGIFIWNIKNATPDFLKPNHRRIYEKAVEKLKI
ncbi:hypothetical protein KAU09_04765 [Candidatus Parcubacteria bacterium]|nr:hypothetical protein [Candidatus Parcubacteria bacterium]